MKCLRPSSLRLLPYLLVQSSTTFLNTSALLTTSRIVSSKVSYTAKANFSVGRKTSGGIYTDHRMVAKITSDSIITTTDDSPPDSIDRYGSPILCTKCHGEGKISKALSKKARIRQQRRLYKQQQEDQNEQEYTESDNHKRIKRSMDEPELSTTNLIGSSARNEGDKIKNFQEPKLPNLPRRWDPCPKCDQTGLLIPSKGHNGESSSPAVTESNNHPLVAIVGGGIGGIALAVALRHRGIPFVVYEKDSRFDQRRQGYGLTLQQARRALQALGIFEASDDESRRSSRSGRLLEEHAVTSTKHVVHTPDGKQVGEWGLRRWVGDSIGPNNAGGTANKVHVAAMNHDKKLDTAERASSQELTNTTNTTTCRKPKPLSSRAKNKKRRQNLHVPRQTLRYALLEALKEASETDTEEAPLSIEHDNLNIAWGHKLVSMNSALGTSGKNGIQLSFEVVDNNKNERRLVTAQADLVVGCDGIRSSVRKHFLRANNNDKTKGMKQETSITPLQYLDCVVILGICPLGDLFPELLEGEGTELVQAQKDKQMQLSPLLDGESVFQTADGTTRIYLMPYSKKNNEYMWQLSFPVPDEREAIELSRRGAKALKEEALRRCQSWHVPIPEILETTPIELVSGYPVYDRQILTSDALSDSRRDMWIPNNNEFSNTTGSLPITLLGDAAHPMSPFKGQGANQALLDALSLARALYRIHCREGRPLEDALEYFEKEMLERSSEKVRASSAAAKFLHTDVAIQEGDVTRGAAFNSSASAIRENGS